MSITPVQNHAAYFADGALRPIVAIGESSRSDECFSALVIDGGRIRETGDFNQPCQIVWLSEDQYRQLVNGRHRDVLSEMIRSQVIERPATQTA